LGYTLFIHLSLGLSPLVHPIKAFTYTQAFGWGRKGIVGIEGYGLKP
jgi:hypothetical protein